MVVTRYRAWSPPRVFSPTEERSKTVNVKIEEKCQREAKLHWEQWCAARGISETERLHAEECERELLQRLHRETWELLRG